MSYSDDNRYRFDRLFDQIDNMEKELEEVHKELQFIKETIVKADTTIAKVAAEVMPTVNSLMEHPMLKVFAGKKAK